MDNTDTSHEEDGFNSLKGVAIYEQKHLEKKGSKVVETLSETDKSLLFRLAQLEEEIRVRPDREDLLYRTEAFFLTVHETLHGLRCSYLPKLFYLVLGWLGFVVIVVLFNRKWFFLSDAVLIALITTTTATVLGLFVIVAKWLFPPPPQLPPPDQKK